MRILGLHFGHDAACAVIEDGRVLGCLEKERSVRIKHAAVLRSANVSRLLDDLHLDIADIDFVAVTSTQNVELVFPDPDELTVRYGPAEGETFGSSIYSPDKEDAFLSSLRCPLGDALRDGGDLGRLGEGRMTADERRHFFDFPRLGTTETFAWLDAWSQNRTLQEIESFDYSPSRSMDAFRHGFHWPASATVFGRTVPGAFFSHHYAHAAYAYYQSGYGDAAIISHDGCPPEGIQSGLFCMGEGNRFWVLAPHFLDMGVFYDVVAAHLGLGYEGGAGKLMGLSSWGSARFFDSRFVGNAFDHGDGSGGSFTGGFLEHCLDSARRHRYSTDPYGDPSQATAPINADIAATAQMVFDETVMRAVRAMDRICETMAFPTSRLCMVGGTGLNCPANSKAYNDGPFREVSVPPACGDADLAIGSALAMYHNVLDYPLVAEGRPPSVFLGLASSASAGVDASGIPAHGPGTVATVPDAVARSAARDLADDLVVGWFEGRSELGPRALGHRSILANPCHRRNWDRVNEIKGRETWRPLAPMALEDGAPAYFDGGPLPSLFMLFTHQVRTRDLPAVTHVDGTARVQTVAADTGGVYEVLREFAAITGYPVLMNTSLNGRGEPIVETPAEAVAFLENSGLDVCYINGVRCARTGR